VSRIALHLQIHGRVQGVAYRYSMTREANALGLSGWVRNRRDGSVEAVLAGPETTVSQLLEWARRGPPAAQVERIEQAPWSGEFPSGPFQQASTI